MAYQAKSALEVQLDVLGALMLRDLAPRIGTTWMQDFHLDPVRRWTAYWKRQLGIIR